jgi:hypothetical protein
VTQPFKRAANSQKPIVPSGGAWNRLVSLVEWLSRLEVGNGLRLEKGPSGPVIIGAPAPSPGGSTTLVKVISAASGGGKYIGRIWMADAAGDDVALTGDLTEAELGDEDVTTGDILILNTSEVGESTHALTDGTPKTKIFIAHELSVVSDEATPKRVFVIPGFDWTLECETAE